MQKRETHSTLSHCKSNAYFPLAQLFALRNAGKEKIGELGSLGRSRESKVSKGAMGAMRSPPRILRGFRFPHWHRPCASARSGLAQDDVDDGVHVVHIHFAIVVDVTGFVQFGLAQNHVDDDVQVFHIHHAAAVDVASYRNGHRQYLDFAGEITV